MCVDVARYVVQSQATAVRESLKSLALNNSAEYDDDDDVIPMSLNPIPMHAGTNPVCRALFEQYAWTNTSLGPFPTWPSCLQTAVDMMLTSHLPIVLLLGKSMHNVYSDRYIHVLGHRHPHVFGLQCKQMWPDVWEMCKEMFTSVVQTGEPTWSEDKVLFVTRNNYLEEAYMTFGYSAIRDEAGVVHGTFCPVIDTTDRVLGTRRTRLLRELGNCTARTVLDLCHATVDVCSTLLSDIPFALIYLFNDKKDKLVLQASCNLSPGHVAAPDEIYLEAAAALTDASPSARRMHIHDCGWPIQEAFDSGSIVEIDLTSRFGEDLPGGEWPEHSSRGVVVPIVSPSEAAPVAGVLVMGINARRMLDDDYRGFIVLLVRHLSSSLDTVQALEHEQQRVSELARMDRAKTMFFNNVSHEFRTPLTLMLGPLEDILARGVVEPDLQRELQLIDRNAQRLLKLVNSLLDFARIEAGRMHAQFIPTDLAQLTVYLASVFRAAIERAGVDFIVSVPAQHRIVFVDRDMFEIILFNLLSNALKFTLQGSISVLLTWQNANAVLIVKDTGVGIPTGEMDKVFERFHQVEGSAGRSSAGTGIGLALTQELVRLHAGHVTVESVCGKGTSFVVTLPLEVEPSNVGQVLNVNNHAATTSLSKDRRAAVYVEEALGWINLPELKASNVASITDAEADSDANHGEVLAGRSYCILLVDNNADMRQYLSSLLRRISTWTVRVAANGLDALHSALQDSVDLIVSDVMMGPGMDGFQLISALRAKESTRHVPVILLSAQAGEEAKVGGLQAGADDYLVKPFSAKELIARVQTHLQLGSMRKELERRVKEQTAELAHALNSLQQSELHFRQMASLLPVGVVRSYADSRISFANDRFAQILGLSVADFARDPMAWVARIHPGDAAVVETWFAALASNVPFKEEIRYVRPDGTVRTTLSQSQLLYTSDPSIDGETQKVEYIIAVTDITDFKQLEVERLEALQRAEHEQQQRVHEADLRQQQELFVDMICHEIRNPLNGIINNADLLATSMNMQSNIVNQLGATCTDLASTLARCVEEDQEAIRAIEVCARHQLVVTNDVLEMSKLEAGRVRLHIVAFIPAEIVRIAVQMFAADMGGKAITYTLHLRLNGLPEGADTFVGLGDPSRISQVLVNILSNAVKFT
eukprot:TRINITY_DN18656_c0_g1_i1.p1 TRINITY_DN18656_c0_g1~~TRINITY_DN18656_c0_g1_i1.p1  ORF type:complete len:1206 (+),score=183.51 TRINITY_DN18656_c0_g1_i1:147-3620(+)